MSEVEHDQNDSMDQEEISQEEKEQLRREVEVEEGPLLPRWLTIAIWSTLGPFLIFAIFWIGRSMVVQNRILDYLTVLSGPWEGEPPSMESKVVTDGRDTFTQKPRTSLLFVMQRMVVPESEDPRMARAMTLRKATKWGKNSARRELMKELLEHMDSEGEIPPNYTLPAKDKKVLQKLIREREEGETASYEQGKITEVLKWIAEGRPTQAKGPERRRIVALEKKYNKRLLVGSEVEVLSSLATKWENSDEPVKRQAAKKFRLMIESEPCRLSEEAVELCKTQADKFEERYLQGQERLSKIALFLVKYIEKNDVFMDHPDVWEVLRLCEHRYKPVRENMKEASYALRNRKYCLRFMSDFLRKTEINPVMAVETARLTKDEHETLLRRENRRRRLALLDVAGRMAKTYCEKPYPITEVPAKKEEAYFNNKVLESIELLTEDDNEEIAERASEVFETVRNPCSEYMSK